MVETSYCLDLVGPERLGQMLRRLEVYIINGALLTHSYLLALLQELLHVPQALTKVIELRQVQKTYSIRILCQMQKNGRKPGHYVSNKESR